MLSFTVLQMGSQFLSNVLIDCSLTVKAATVIFIHVPGHGSAISSANKGNQVLFIIW